MTELVFLDELSGENLPQRPGFDGKLEESLEPLRGGAISIGNFDGVHLGHAELLKQVRLMADRVDGPAIAVTFAPHPAALLRPNSAPKRLTSMELRAQRMSKWGIDALVVCPTTWDLLKLSAEEFFDKLVLQRLAARAVVEGPNFFFGRERLGNVETLQQLTDTHGIECLVVAPSVEDGEMISSSGVRSLLARGEVSKILDYGGWPHQIEGIVGVGEKRGRQIGFPTANLTQIDVALPAQGVYAGIVTVENQTFSAAIHIGPNPTFDTSEKVKVEVHLLDYDGDLYQQTLQVSFIARLRGISKFETPEQLVGQLQQDIQATRDILANQHTPPIAD